MSSRQWLDNAFWETDEKKQVNCILELEDDAGRVTRQVMKLNRLTKDGEENPDFNEVIETLGEESITNNTIERRERKSAEQAEKKQREIEHAKARKLEDLFNYKMESFEVEQIKDSKNRKLKGKLRRAKSKVEVDLYAMMILKEVIDNEENSDGGEE